MKVLYIDKLYPYPPNDGRNIRAFNLIAQLSRRHDVTLLCHRVAGLPEIPLPIKVRTVAFKPGTRWYVGPLINLFSLKPYHQQYFNTKELAAAVRECVGSEQYDLVILDSVYLVGLLPQIRFLPVVINEHNYEPGIMRDRCRAEANPFVKAFFYLQHRKVLRLQRWAVRQPGVSFVCVSEQDATHIRKLAPAVTVALVPNGVDVARFAYSAPAEFGTICFLGSLAWAPNVDGLAYFISTIWPRIKQLRPGLKLSVVGQDPDNVAARFAAPDIAFTGAVEDIIPHVRATAVFVVPIRYGGGTKLKVLEAMALGRPVVTTTKGAEGIDGIQDGVNAVIADSPAAFAAAVVDLIGTPERAVAIGAAGRRLVERQYEWNSIGRSLDAWLRSTRQARDRNAASGGRQPDSPGRDICVITSAHQPFDTRIFKKECRSLVAAGFRVTLLAPVDRDEEVIDGVRVLGFGGLKGRSARLFNLYRICRMAVALDADLYHIHEPELLLLLPILRILNRRTKFIYDVHENYSDAIRSAEKHWIPEQIKPAVAWAMNTAEKGLAKKSDLIIAASPDIEVRFDGCRTISIRNYAPMDIINGIYENRGSLPRPPSAEIIYTGSMTRTRGILEIVRAIDLVDKQYDVRFVVTGKFHHKEYQRLVESSPGYHRVENMGYLPSYEAMVARVINANAAMVCFHEDLNLDNAVERSNKLFEYMGMGLPVIVSDLPDWAAMITKYRCGVVVNADDPADIARKIERILSDPREAYAMGQRGRRAVLDHYRWMIEGQRLVEVYRQLLSEG